MAFHISQTLLDRYTSGPSPAKIQQAKDLHEAVTKALGPGYDTFLQGSYRNSTGVPDLNDVDVVALKKDLRIQADKPWLYAHGYVEWSDVFLEVGKRLLADSRFRGLKLSDKCLKLDAMGFRADVVPAATYTDDGKDPIAIYSFREAGIRATSPRTHYQRAVLKQAATKDQFKPTVRMFKRWAKHRFHGTTVAPSYYAECAVYSAPSDAFNAYPPLAFAKVGLHLHGAASVLAIEDRKQLLSEAEWGSAAWETFRTALLRDVELALEALDATNPLTADRLWRQVFGE